MLSWPEVQFFLGYGIGFLAVLILLFRWHHLPWMLPKENNLTLHTQPDPYILAWLMRGKSAAVQAAIVSLFQKHQIRNHHKDPYFLIKNPKAPPAKLSLLEDEIRKELKYRDKLSFHQIDESMQLVFQPLREQAQRMGWYQSDTILWVQRMAVLAYITIGAYHILQVLDNKQHAETTFYIWILGSLVLLTAYLFRRKNTLLAENIILAIRQQYQKTQLVNTSESLDWLYPLMVGMYGYTVLEDTPLAPCMHMLAERYLVDVPSDSWSEDLHHFQQTSHDDHHAHHEHENHLPNTSSHGVHHDFEGVHHDFEGVHHDFGFDHDGGHFDS